VKAAVTITVLRQVAKFLVGVSSDPHERRNDLDGVSERDFGEIGNVCEIRTACTWTERPSFAL